MGLEGAEKGMDVRRHSAYMTPLNPPQILLEQCFSGRVDFAPRAHWGRSEDTCVCHNLGRGVCYCIFQVEARVLLTSYNARHSPPPPRQMSTVPGLGSAALGGHGYLLSQCNSRESSGAETTATHGVLGKFLQLSVPHFPTSINWS